MRVKSNALKVDVLGKLPITLEGAQLALQNAERLFNDSQQVSIPTRVALLEIGLEEIAKTWGILLGYEKNLFDNNPDFLKTFFQLAHIVGKSYNKKMSELEDVITEFFDKVDQTYFLTPFDTISFSNHEAKIEFLSKFIKYIREIQLPLLRSSSDRAKLKREILGRYISKNKSLDTKEGDKIIDNILDVDVEQLRDIVNLKEYGLYLHVQNDVYIYPSARSFETETLVNLLALLIGMAKNEVSLLFIVLGKAKKIKKVGK
jgi:hypothetical protein